VPVHDEQRLFEFLILEGAQAGLSWSTILNKRERYRDVYEGFDPERVATFGSGRIEALLTDPGIVRNRLKVQSSVTNARCFLQVRSEFGRFDTYIWRFTEGRTLQNTWHSHLDIPTATKESEAMSRDLKQRGFRFVGPTICYAFMQAVGMVNDHTLDCFRHAELQVK
jgi:DNA-3-methyladenine glycosylase I